VLLSVQLRSARTESNFGSDPVESSLTGQARVLLMTVEHCQAAADPQI